MAENITVNENDYNKLKAERDALLWACKRARAYFINKTTDNPLELLNTTIKNTDEGFMPMYSRTYCPACLTSFQNIK